MTCRLLAGIGILCIGSGVLNSSVFAAGFALQEHSVAGLGNAFAGGAAIAEDATTVYFNPAGLSLIEKPQLSLGMHFVAPEADFENQGTTTLGVPTQGGNSVSEEDAILPNLFYAAPLNDDLAWGIGLSAPFGLATDYEEGWVGRYIALRTELETVSVNPSLAYRVNDQLSIGFGVSYVTADATFGNAVDMGLVFLDGLDAGRIPTNAQTAAIAADVQANLGGPKYDGSSLLEGDGDGWGFNFGAIYEVSETLRFGAHYRSEVALELSGMADFEVGLLEPILGPAFPDQGGQVSVDLPASISLSVYGEVNERLALMADVTRAFWTSFESLVLEFPADSPPDVVIPENWENVNKYSVGASYRLTDRLLGRFGLAYDESPVPSDEFRSPRIPDEDRTWVTLGLSVAATESLDLHVSYLHVFLQDPTIDNASHAAGQRLVGRLSASVDLLSLGLSKRF